MNQNSRKSGKTLLLQGAIATLATGTIFAPGLINPVLAELADSPKAVVDEVWQIVNHEFVDGEFNHVEWQEIRQELLTQDYTSKKQAYKAIGQALEELGDPYTRFLTPEEFAVLTSQTAGELSGVGVFLGKDKHTNDLIVLESLKNSPATAAGIKAGDRLVRIDGKPTALMTLEEASAAIRGEVGTEVSLHISRPGEETFEVMLTRENIEVASVSYRVKDEGSLLVGYIKLDEFSSHAAEQMKKAIAEFHQEQVSGLVLDLRGNPGGLLFASVDIARMFIKQGEIVHTVDRLGGDRQFSANNSTLTDLPLVVLVDENSASASEILAGALKESGRGTVVGTNTYGKGTVQSVHNLSDGSGLAVTMARYYPPSGLDINHQGIAPDVPQALTSAQQRRLVEDPSLVATNADPQYYKAISVLRSNLPSTPISIK
ncbi:MAG: PDZ domain-containing protein [Gomphosphaeria aponina SAG 52.96 = DSM 107014]|uniref:PDZ domain-containing protein n=1 Tax=Gomphosphaeria aponina SAG 52.96 = DSM 107014 TaxID=1521640 RepID=A0A941GWY0_9CHRO|nr:PDZ domain-containing protein [Gomphosphaeria aponina SAG 52.96 = DSM 107014]